MVLMNAMLNLAMYTSFVISITTQIKYFKQRITDKTYFTSIVLFIFNWVLKIDNKKIGRNLRSVSPDNFLDKNYKGTPLNFCCQKILNLYHLEHKLKKTF